MEDKKYYYSISWKQPYEYSISYDWIEQAQTDIVESKLESGDFTEANEVLKRIMSL